jgi:bla regulator protein BlaR1
MPALFMFLFKVNIALLLFCMGYYLVLRHLTFYTLNRIYLAAAILFSSIYPWINISGFMQRHQQLTAPVQNVILQWRAPAENLVKPLDQPNYWLWAEWVFWAGAILFALRLIVQLLSLYKLYRDSEPGHVHNYPVRLIDGDVSPFSFWRSIYINPSKLSPSDLEKVLEHEQVHVNQWHTLDILLAELSTVFYWFNPGIWLMKKAVKENIEFITDCKILQRGIDSKQYQYSLLNVSMAGSPNKLVNNFNISTIKKRIVMMNAKRSSRLNLGRYIFVAPAVIILLLVFSISRADVAKRAIHTFTLSLINVANNNKVKPKTTHPARLSTAKLYKINVSKKAAADTVYAGKSKNGKKNMLITSDKSLDSIGYVINGAKATREEVKGLDPGKIMSLDMMSAEYAKKFVDFQLDKPDVLFVTTDDSEKGKSLKEQIDKSLRYGVVAGANGNSNVSTNIDVAPGSSRSYSVASSSGSTDAAPVAAGSNVSVATTVTSSSDAAPEVMVVGRSQKSTNYTISTTPKGKPITVTGYNIVAPEASNEVITVDSSGKRSVNYLVRGKNVVYITKTGAKNDELIFIVDGKQLTSLKSVDSKDIKSVTVLTDKNATNKYGDKGKNGVIEITTNKGKAK